MAKRGPIAKPIEERFWPKVKKTRNCWLWTAYLHPDGYGMISVTRSRPTWAHRIAWVLKYGPIPEGKQVLHHCDNRRCVNPNHLFLGTNADNIADRINKKRPGPSQKLSEKDILEIRALWGSGEYTQDQLAYKFGVRDTNISAIVRRATWKHLAPRLF